MTCNSLLFSCLTDQVVPVVRLFICLFAGFFRLFSFHLGMFFASQVPNRPFYRYSGHVELTGFKEHYGMPGGGEWGHKHDPIYLHQYLLALFGPIFL